VNGIELKEALRYLLLPIQAEEEETCIKAASEILTKNRLKEEDYSVFIKNSFQEWKDSDKLNSVLKEIIEQVLIASDKSRGELISVAYFEVHQALRTNPLMSFEIVTVLLSQLRLMATLAADERMSSTKIAAFLKSVDSRLTIITWREVRVVLRKLGLMPIISVQNAEKTYVSDEKSEELSFADSDVTNASFLVGEVARNLKFDGDLEFLLNQLTKPGGTHLPYLQILHYQCLVSEFYDHVISFAYEFSPRGILADWLFSKWNNLIPTNNPFLNNAKAVEVLDKNWASSRSSNESVQAHALVDILRGVDGMSFTASQELASWLRRWLIRYIKLNESKVTPVPEKSSVDRIVEIVSFVTGAPTKTFGILEQRLVDFLAISLYEEKKGWRQRGIGDSINSNNLAKRKLGDCDFQDHNAKEIIAFEAHGGTLSQIYLDGHLRTLVRAIDARSEELMGIAELNEWKINLVFVAYEFTAKNPGSIKINGIAIKIEFLKFKDLVSKVDLKSKLLEYNFVKTFTLRINDRNTPQKVRDIVLEIVNKPNPAETKVKK
jgi:hypothetical protein